jgi:hypothetical protein
MNVQHERNFHLRTKLRGTRAAAQLEVPWKTNGIIAQCVFFLLTCVALGASYALIHVFDVSMPGLIIGVAAIVLAEYLIGARRWFFTGVETALWGGGVFAALTELQPSDKPEAWLVLAAASAIAGARVRNPLFGALSAILVMIYCEKRFDLGVVSALVITLIACLALLRTWRRPSVEALWIALALVMPIAGRFTADKEWRTMTIALYATLGAIALALGIARRHHAFFLTAMIALGIAAMDVGERVNASLEAKLAVAGALLLVIAFALSRALRDRTRGFVLTPLALTPIDDTAEVAATFTR